MNMRSIVVITLVIGLVIGFSIGYATKSAVVHSSTAPLGISVLAAGSLGYALKELGQNWSVVYPQYSIPPGGGIFMGSVKAAKQISELHQSYDIYATAAADVIPHILYPHYASWMIVFATNEISILYAPNSTASLTINGMTYHVNEINTQNWWKFITAPGVIVGMSNGSTDPAGFQAIQAMKLAGIYLVQHENHAYNQWFHNVLGYPINDTNAIFQDIWIHKYHTGHIRPVGIEANLDALISSGSPEFGISYKSLAKSYGLGYVKLPWQINLGATNISAIHYYAQVNSSGAPIGLSGSSVQAHTPAGPIFYAVTIPKNALNRVIALEYLILLLGPTGEQVLENTYFNPIIKPYAVKFNNTATIPSVLIPYTQPLPPYLQSGSGYTAIMG